MCVWLMESNSDLYRSSSVALDDSRSFTHATQSSTSSCQMYCGFRLDSFSLNWARGKTIGRGAPLVPRSQIVARRRATIRSKTDLPTPAVPVITHRDCWV